MRYTIENEALIAEIDDKGAELRVLRAKADGYDYLWSGDPAVWAGTAPILFPFVGGLIHGSYQYQGQTFAIRKHGFARQSTFTLSEQTTSTLVLTLTDTAEALANYPFPFRLDIRFALEGNRLTATHTVTNKGNADMWFSLGAHPAFACEAGDIMRFETPETIEAYRLDNDLLTGTEPFLTNSDTWPLSSADFTKDAYILEGLASKAIILERENARNLRFWFDAPYLGIWAKPGARYVCLEPWFGVDDAPQHDGDLTTKKGIQRLNAGDHRTLTYMVDTL